MIYVQYMIARREHDTREIYKDTAFHVSVIRRNHLLRNIHHQPVHGKLSLSFIQHITDVVRSWAVISPEVYDARDAFLLH